MQRQNVASKCNIKVQRQNVKLKSATSKCNVKMQRQKFNVKMQRQNTTRKKKMQRNKCNEKCNVKNAMAKMQEEKKMQCQKYKSQSKTLRKCERNLVSRIDKKSQSAKSLPVLDCICCSHS